MATPSKQLARVPRERAPERVARGLRPELQAALLGPPDTYILDEELYELQGMWWPALLIVGDRSFTWCLPFLGAVTHPDDFSALARRLLDQEDTLEVADLRVIAESLVERVTGRKWWTAGRLAAVIHASWEVLDGRLLGKGVDLQESLRYEPARAFNVVSFMLYESQDEKGRRKLDTELQKPPAGMAKERRSVAEDAAAFEAAFAAGLGV